MAPQDFDGMPHSRCAPFAMTWCVCTGVGAMVAMTWWEFNLPAEDQFHVFAGYGYGAVAVFPLAFFLEVAVFRCSWDDDAMSKSFLFGVLSIIKKVK